MKANFNERVELSVLTAPSSADEWGIMPSAEYKKIKTCWATMGWHHCGKSSMIKGIVRGDISHLKEVFIQWREKRFKSLQSPVYDPVKRLSYFSAIPQAS